MKTIYEVSCKDKGLDTSYGTFPDYAFATDLCKRINAYNPKMVEIGLIAEVYPIDLYEEGDPIFTHIALYSVVNDTYETYDMAPTMFEHWGGFDSIREAMRMNKDQGAFGRAGTSAEDALQRLTIQIETLKGAGLVDSHRAHLLKRKLAEQQGE